MTGAAHPRNTLDFCELFYIVKPAWCVGQAGSGLPEPHPSNDAGGRPPDDDRRCNSHRHRAQSNPAHNSTGAHMGPLL